MDCNLILYIEIKNQNYTVVIVLLSTNIALTSLFQELLVFRCKHDASIQQSYRQCYVQIIIPENAVNLNYCN